MVDKMHAFTVFTKKYIQPYGCSGNNFTVSVNCTSSNTETQNETIETEIIEAQI